MTVTPENEEAGYRLPRADYGEPEFADFEENGAREAQTIASVPFMITMAMKEKLAALGYSQDAISNTLPADAHKIINGQIKAVETKPKEVKPSCLEPDAAQIETFVNLLLRYAHPESWVNIRAFHDDASRKTFRQSPTQMKGGAEFLAKVAIDDARRAANALVPVVFCPPIASFIDGAKADEPNLAQGFSITVDLDKNPREARQTLEAILGKPTLAVASGGSWADPTTGELIPKVHLHWRLNKAAQGDNLEVLKKARKLAIALVDGDPTAAPIVHPFRWAGSWHRKDLKNPKLCQIVEQNPDVEIGLEEALGALTIAAERAGIAANQPQPSTGPSGATQYPAGEDWNVHIDRILKGEYLHASTRGLSAKLLQTGMQDGANVNLVRALLEMSPRRTSDPYIWQSRWQDIPKLVRDERAKIGPTHDHSQDSAPAPIQLPGQAPPLVPTAPASPFTFNIRPYKCPVEMFIPARDWVYGRHYLRGAVSCTVAAGGRAKTSLEHVEAMSMAIGRDLLTGFPCTQRRVLHLNAEEPQHELDLRFAAIRSAYGIKDEEYEGWLFVESLTDLPQEQRPKFAWTDRFGNAFPNMPVVEAFIDKCRELKIDVAQIDPLISFHKIRENVNEDMDVLVKEAFGLAAQKVGMSVDLSHHVRKPGQGQESSTIEDARGGGALVFACRIARVLNFITPGEASTLQIDETLRKRYIKIDDGKGNPKPLGAASWVEIEGQNLTNGEEVATLRRWQPATLTESLPSDTWQRIRALVRTGAFRVSDKSPEWLGWAVAKDLGIDIFPGGGNPKHLKAKVCNILFVCEKNKVIAREERPDEKRRPRAWYILGSMNDEGSHDDAPVLDD
jgi:hypothetical protein